jgi:hypothetical protein
MLKSPKVKNLSQDNEIRITSSGERLSRADGVLSPALLWSIWARQNHAIDLSESEYVQNRIRRHKDLQSLSSLYYFYVRNQIVLNSELFQRVSPTTDKINHGIRNKLIQKNSRFLTQKCTFPSLKPPKHELHDLKIFKRMSFFNYDTYINCG